MSSMLEQAILDAKELKEAAIKNAQQALVEKYSNEFESEIEKLLEQADPAAATSTLPAAPAATPAAGLGVPAMPGATPAGAAPVDPEKAKSDSDSKSDIFEKLEYAFKDGEVIEDKAYPTGVVEIDLDSLSEFSFKKNQQKTPEQMALQELKNLSKESKLDEELYDDEEDYDDNEEDEEEDEESTDDLFPYGDSDDEEDLGDIQDYNSEDHDEDEDLDDEEFSDDEDLYDDGEEEKFEIDFDFENDQDEADYDPDADVEDFEDDEDEEESDEEEYYDDEQDEEDSEEDDEEEDEEDDLEESKKPSKAKHLAKKGVALAAAASTMLGSKEQENIHKAKKSKEEKHVVSEEDLEENEHKHSGAVEEILMKIEALQNSLKNKNIKDASVEARLESIIKAVKKLTDEEKKELKEVIKLDYKRTGPRSKWNGMFHEEAEHDVELANLQAQIEEMEQEVEHLQETNKKLKSGLKDSIKLNESLSKKIQNYEQKLFESRILNYKLLYTNKALSDSSLNGQQKNKIAESINNAKTAEEVKLLYETLKSTMRDGTSNSTPKSLSEAVERRSSSLLLRGTRAEPKKQDDIAERMKRLAGL